MENLMKRILVQTMTEGTVIKVMMKEHIRNLNQKHHRRKVTKQIKKQLKRERKRRG
jgi:hypothetical protein